FKVKIMKLERTVDKIEKQNQIISQAPASSSLPVKFQLSSPPPIEDHSDKEYSIKNDQSHVILTESPSLQTEVSKLEQDDKIDKNQIIE
ncbi:5485_t:CDS:2, partial [Ambispora leptoticha]